MQSRRPYLCIVYRRTCLCASTKPTPRKLHFFLSPARQHPRCLLKIQCTSHHGGACTSSNFLARSRAWLPSFSLPRFYCCWQQQHWLAAAACVFCICVCAKAAFVRVFCIYARAHKWIVCISNAHPVRFDEPHRRHACANVSARCSDIARGQNLILLLVLIESRCN
jgi:hypothetical protein